MSSLWIEKIGAMGYAIIPFVLALTIIVFVHELGHFLIARHHGVHVTTFSIGYGKELVGWTDKRGTRWRISMIPLGGYVMMLGDADASSVRANLKDVREENLPQTLSSKTPLQRMMVAFGGPLMNIFFTFAVFVLIGLWKGVPDMEPRIQSVLEASVAEKCGLVSGDIITGINDQNTRTVSEMKKWIQAYKGQDVTLHYLRKGVALSSMLALYETDSEGGKTPLNAMGVALQGPLLFTHASVGQALVYGGSYCYNSAISIVSGLGKTLMGKKDGAKFGSILSIGDIANQSMENGFFAFLNFMAMLSFSLAIFNLFPIPVLDGGSIMLSAVEWIRKEPLSERVINVVYMTGIGVVALLMLWSMWNDLVRYNIMGKIVGIFHRFFS